MQVIRRGRLAAPLSMALAAAAAVAALAPAGALAAACTFTTIGPLKRLNADCTTTQTITIPNGGIFDGQGHTITATDPAGGFKGAILQNAGASATVQNVRLQTQGLAVNCHEDNDRLAGVRFDGASGSITNTQILSLNQGASGCQEGNGIEVRNAPYDGTHPATKQVTVSGDSIQNYQKTGLLANGDVRVTVANSDIGKSATQANLSANAVQLGFGASGSVVNSQIKGNQNLIPGGADSSDATAVLLFQAPGVSVARNAIGGNANIGIAVVESPRANVLSNQVIDETADGGAAGLDDIGIYVDSASRPGSSVIANTIRCYAVPVEIEGTTPDALGPNTVQACNQVTAALQVASRMARFQGQVRGARVAVVRP